MSDLGSDMGNSGVSFMGNMVGKLLDAIMKVFAALFKTFEKRLSADYKLQKFRMKEEKQKYKINALKEKMPWKEGIQNYKKLTKAGVELVPLGLCLNKEDMKSLGEMCKKCGVTITGVKDVKSTLQGKDNVILYCKKEDVPKIAEIIDFMNVQKRVEKIQVEIESIKEKITDLKNEITKLNQMEQEEGLSPEDEARRTELLNEVAENELVIKKLQGEIEKAYINDCKSLNDIQARDVLKNIFEGDSYKGVPFNEAINRFTSRKLDKGITAYLVDKNDPDKYIIARADNAEYNGEQYIKSTYEVYHGENKVMTTDDGRFDGRPANWWSNKKCEMRNAIDMSDSVLKFYSKEDYIQYKKMYLQYVNTHGEENTYREKNEELKEVVNTSGYTYSETGDIVSNETGEKLDLDKIASSEEKIKVADCIVASKTIKNNINLEKAETKVEIATSEVLTTKENTPENLKAKTDLDKAQKELDKELDVKNSLSEQWRDLCFLKALNESDKFIENRVTNTINRDDREGIEEGKLKMVDYKEKIALRSNTEVKSSEINKSKSHKNSKNDREVRG